MPHRGVAKHVDTGYAGLIVHLSGITKLGPDPNNKVQVCSVEEAVRNSTSQPSRESSLATDLRLLDEVVLKTTIHM